MQVPEQVPVNQMRQQTREANNLGASKLLAQGREQVSVTPRSQEFQRHPVGSILRRFVLDLSQSSADGLRNLLNKFLGNIYLELVRLKLGRLPQDDNRTLALLPWSLISERRDELLLQRVKLQVKGVSPLLRIGFCVWRWRDVG